MKFVYVIPLIIASLVMGAVFSVWRTNPADGALFPIPAANYEGMAVTSSCLVCPMPTACKDLVEQAYTVRGCLITPVEVTYSDGAVVRHYRYERIENE